MFIHWGTRMYVENVMAIHVVDVEIFPLKLEKCKPHSGARG